ncbi:MAG: PilZ domain-containing protein [Sphingomonas adhaesiva]|uniref:PilZ domain-containing protein n=1 Tax=Sphingomonas adhaesiva TaxID=28212 RepID=UPI002FF53C22
MPVSARRSAPASSIDQRRAPRHPVDCRATAKLALSISILDASLLGLRGRASLPLPSGTLLNLTLPGHAARHARVTWAEGDTFGCEFLKPLSHDELRRLTDATNNAPQLMIG